MSFARYKPLYVSLYASNTAYDAVTKIDTYSTSSVENTINAEVNEVYNIPVVPKASDYLVAIERLEISLNAIPFYDASDAEVIIIRSRMTDDLNVAPLQRTTLTENAYSLTQLLDYLNSLDYTNPNENVDPVTGIGDDLQLQFSLDKDGFIAVEIMDGTDFNEIQIEFPRKLNMILGISVDAQVQGLNPPVDFATSSLPRIDLGDNLEHIIVRTNLPTYTDTLGNVKTNVMTDFCIPTAYSNSLTYGVDNALIKSGFSTNLRQKAIYIPNERRYLELVGDFPINNISVTCMYVDPSHVTKNVVIPFGGVFEVKLGFYLKS